MKARNRFLITACLSVLASAGAALGDGSVFVHRVSYEDILQPTQKVYIRWDGSQEDLLIQTKYEGPAEEMVWIVPVPAEPNVTRGDGAVFEDLSGKTAWPGITCTSFTGISGPSFSITIPTGIPYTLGGSSPVQWRRRIGDYDVVLLRPIGAEDVLQWLITNGFAVPDKAVPILEDYIREQWWMVASKIYPDALTDITREKLASGTLNPLQLSFRSSACVYPLRLTGLAAGDVEELIYIEGPTHYVPATLSDGDWLIDIFGGPVRQVPQYHYLSDVELAIEALNGRTKTKAEPSLTKLRRVFKPEEMTCDLVFEPMDESKWLESGNPLLIGEAATQVGRSRDPNAVVPLLTLLTSGILEQVRPESYQYQPWPSLSAKILDSDSYDGLRYWTAYHVKKLADGSERMVPIGGHVFSAIWALGEIAVEHKGDADVEELLLQCARHDNQLVRMEAYIALMKLRSDKLGPILAEGLTYIPQNGPASASSWGGDVWSFGCEMNIVTDWIARFGTTSQKEALADALTRAVEGLGGLDKYSVLTPQRSTPTKYYWFEWVLWQAAATQDERLIAPLESLYGRIADANQGDAALAFVLRAQAACGSSDATDATVRRIADDETGVLADGQGPTPEGMTSLSSYCEASQYITTVGSIRVQVLQKHWWRYELYPMPSAAGDRTLRLALSRYEMSDWYTLYLLAGIKEPQAEDKARLSQIWDKDDPWLRLMVIDVLYTWNDWRALLSLQGTTGSDDVESEIVWALGDLGIAQAVDVVEERARGSWNAEWQRCGRAFIIPTWTEITEGDPNFNDAVRKAQTLQTFFHPAWEGLDELRLTALKRLCEDSSVHPGVRFMLLATDYATKDWATDLLAKATRDVLEAYPVSSTAAMILYKADVQLIVDACGQFTSDDARRSLLISLLASGSIAYLPTIEGLLRQVWPQRYTETQGQSVLFTEPGDLAASIDYYCACNAVEDRVRSPVIAGSRFKVIVEDDSLPAGYRAFLLAYWPTAPDWVSRELVEDLLLQEMPDYIREALEQRLADWP
jgi:hypothetical protein